MSISVRSFRRFAYDTVLVLRRTVVRASVDSGSSTRTARVFGALTCASAFVLTTTALSASPQVTTTRVSVGPNGVQANSGTDYAVVSGDGRYILVESYASNLVPGDTNDCQDVFRYDRQTGGIVRVSVDSNGGQANGDSGTQSVSGDGRYVAFATYATNLTSIDFNGGSDVYVRDIVAGTLTLVSSSNSGIGTANSASWSPVVSRDGRFIAFYSSASDLLSAMPDQNGSMDTFVYEIQTGLITLVSQNSQGQQGNDDSADGPFVPGSTPAISGDGRYIAFESKATNLVPNYSPGHLDVFLRDTLLGITKLVSCAADGTQGTWYSRAPALSIDGRYVAFGTRSPNLVPNDTNGAYDYFVKDMLSGAIERVNVSTSGAQATGGGIQYAPLNGPTISGDGRFVAFGSACTSLVTPDTNGAYDVFVRDRLLGTTTFASVSSSGEQGNAISSPISISDNGSVIVFASLATNLVPGDTNATADAFARLTVLPYVAFCFGDASSLATPCPCSNPGEIGHGCENAHSTGGGLLFATGTPSVSADTLELRAFGLPHASVAIFLQGTAQQNAGQGTVFGDGLRCLAGAQVRLGHHAASSTGSTAFGFGVAGDPLVSVRGSIPSVGGTRYYQVHYRDGAAFCTSESFNWSNGIRIAWTP